MASTNPARALGSKSKGVLEVGHDADFTILSPELEVLQTFVGGVQLFPVAHGCLRRCDLKGQQKPRDIDRRGGGAELCDVRRPVVPEGCVIGKDGLHRAYYGLRGERESATICFHQEPRVSFFLTGNDVIDNHRASRGHGLLHNCAAGFADEQVTRPQETRKFFAPPDDIERVRRHHANFSTDFRKRRSRPTATVN